MAGVGMPIIHRVGLRTRLVRGTSLVESLVAVLIIAVCATPILTAVSSSQERLTEAQQRLIVLQEVQSELDNQRSKARTGLMVVQALVRELNLPTLSDPIEMETSVTLVSGYIDLFQVRITATWASGSSPVQLTTYMRCPDV